MNNLRRIVSGFGLLAALGPSRQAANLKVVEALRQE